MDLTRYRFEKLAILAGLTLSFMFWLARLSGYSNCIVAVGAVAVPFVTFWDMVLVVLLEWADRIGRRIDVNEIQPSLRKYVMIGVGFMALVSIFILTAVIAIQVIPPCIPM